MSQLKSDAEFWAKRVVSARNDAQLDPAAVQVEREYLNEIVRSWANNEPAEFNLVMDALKARA